MMRLLLALLLVAPAALAAQLPTPWVVDTAGDPMTDEVEVRAWVPSVASEQGSEARLGMYCSMPSKRLEGMLVTTAAVDITFVSALSAPTVVTRVRFNQEKPDLISWERAPRRSGRGAVLQPLMFVAPFAKRLQAYDEARVELPLLGGGAEILRFRLGDSLQSPAALQHVFDHCKRKRPQP